MSEQVGSYCRGSILKLKGHKTIREPSTDKSLTYLVKIVKNFLNTFLFILSTRGQVNNQSTDSQYSDKDPGFILPILRLKFLDVLLSFTLDDDRKLQKFDYPLFFQWF